MRADACRRMEPKMKGPFLRWLFVIGMCLSGCMSHARTYGTSGAPTGADVSFEHYEVMTGAATRQTVLTGFLRGGAVAELAVLNIEENADRRVRIYAFEDNTWKSHLDATLGPDVLFVDVTHIDGRDRLLLYRPGRMSWFDPDLATEHALLAVTSNFTPPRQGEIPHVDLSRDVTHDGRDDLVVSDVDGFWVFVQMDDGEFAAPVRIGRPAELSGIYGADGYRYSPWQNSRVHEVDYDRDGRSDLVFWNEDHFEMHRQDEHGMFGSVGETFTIDVAFDSDELSSLAVGDMAGKVLHSFTDLSGDGVADLVFFSLKGRRISTKRSIYEVHFGMPEPDGGTRFGAKADLSLQSDGIQLAMDRHDFDSDGEIDMMFTTIDRGFLRNNLYARFKGRMGGEIKLDVEFYRVERGRYADTPNATRRINLQYPGAHSGPGWVPLDLALRGGKHESRNTQDEYLRAFNSILLIGDVTGDSRLDLLVGWDRRSVPGLEFHPADLFEVYVGVPTEEVFSGSPTVVPVPMPDHGDYVWLEDLNKDGKQDIVLHHPSCCRGDMHREATTEPPRVTLLLAR